MQNYTKATIKYIFKHIKREWKLFALVMLGLSIDKFFGTITPVFYKQFIDLVASNNPQVEGLYHILIIIMLAKLGAWAGRRLFDQMLNIFEPKIMMAIQEECFDYVQRHSYDFFINNFAGSIVKKVNRLPNAFERLLDSFVFNLYPLIFQIILSLWILLFVDKTIAAVLIGWVLLYILANYKISKIRQKYNNEMNAMDSKLGGVLADTISNNFNVSLFSTHQRESKYYKSLTQEWRAIFTKGWRIMTIGDAIFGLLMIALEVMILYFSIKSWRAGSLSVGDFVLIQGLLGRVLDSLWGVGKIIRDFGRGLSDAREMIEILETPHEVVDKPDAKDIKIKKGAIEIKNLNFSYTKDKDVFKDFNLNIAPGKKVALVSKSGGGKTTIVRLLLRLYNVPEDSIFIDGQDVMKVTQDSLRRSISLVPQDPVLFHRTLAENIAYSRPDATQEEIVLAAKKAHCHEFIEKLADGYNTYVGERGVKLSGGERQRVAIARAILEDAPILILDEATSALDSESEKLIQEALHELMKRKTTIAIAHRLSTISQMDELIVLENGKIVDRGTHTELIQKAGSQYKRLWDIQAGGFE